MTKRNVEQERLAPARRTLGTLLSDKQWLPDVGGIASGVDSAAEFGRRMFIEEANHAARDDRRLYWRRLAAISALESAGVNTAEFEAGSRGLLDMSFNPEVNHRVLVTGFDPFHLDSQITQANPSGVLALQMANRSAEIGQSQIGTSSIVQIRSVVMPVRFADFDAQIIEQLVESVLPDISMIITVSMGRDGFDLERFPGRRRSAETPDNMNLYGGGTESSPSVPIGADGPEFVEFSLPVSSMMPVAGPYDIRDNRVVQTLESGEMSPNALIELDGFTAVEGSGGGYLSNEISWRVLNTLRRARASIPAGHIHTPRMAGFDQKAMGDITAQCRVMIEAAVASL